MSCAAEAGRASLAGETGAERASAAVKARISGGGATAPAGNGCAHSDAATNGSKK